MIQVNVLFFATLKDRAGLSQVTMDLPESSQVHHLKELLSQHFPALQDAIPSVLVSINREFAFDEDHIPPGAEVALFPPVSGGGIMEHIHDPVSLINRSIC